MPNCGTKSLTEDVKVSLQARLAGIGMISMTNTRALWVLHRLSRLNERIANLGDPTLLSLNLGKLPKHIKKIRPPGYWKDKRSGKRKLVILIRCDCYRFEGEKLKIPKKLHLKWQGRPRWRNWKKQGLLTIFYDELKNKWYVRQPVEIKPQHQPLSNQRAYIDIGVLNLLTVLVDNDRQTIAYSGRSALADWWYLSHRINKLKGMAKRINNQELTKQIRSLYRRRRLRFRQYVNTTIRRAVFNLYKRGVSKIITGDLTGILDGRGTKKGNTMTHNFWSHNYVIQRLSEVAEEYGLVVKFVDERGTSSKCIRCDSRQITRRGRLVKCLDCGLKAHRDTVGAVNISVVSGGRINGVMAHPLEIDLRNPRILA